MDAGLIGEIGIGSCLGLAAVGSAAGTAVAGLAVIGAWKKCFIQNKPPPFILVAFAGCPLTQVIYGFILMQSLLASTTLNGYQLLGLGLFSGLALFTSSYMQSQCCAAAADAYVETGGQGFGQYMLVLGLCETAALFTMVFSMLIAAG